MKAWLFAALTFVSLSRTLFGQVSSGKSASELLQRDLTIAPRSGTTGVSRSLAESSKEQARKVVPTISTNASYEEIASKALSSAQGGEVAVAMKLVEELRRGFGETPHYFETKGTVQTLGKDYPGAEASFSKMLELQPDSHVARFNRAETLMLQGRFVRAESEFSIVEKERSEVDAPVADLARFKRVACMLGQEKVMAAELLVPPIKESGESPAVYYSRAMIHWVRKDTAAAIRTLDEARTRFPREVDELYTDTFVELQWGRRDGEGKFSFAPKFR